MDNLDEICVVVFLLAHFSCTMADSPYCPAEGDLNMCWRSNCFGPKQVVLQINIFATFKIKPQARDLTWSPNDLFKVSEIVKMEQAAC